MSAIHIIVASLGGVAQFVGAFLVLRESARLRRSELGQLSIFRRFWNEVRRTSRNPAPAVLGPLSATSVSSTSATLIVRPPETPEEATQRRLEEFEDGLQRIREQLASETQNLRGRVAAVETSLEEQIGAVREKRRSDIARAIDREQLGTYVFLLGVVLSLVANLVS